MYAVIDLPQHLLVAFVVSNFFSNLAVLALSVVVPLMCKAILLCTTQGSNLNKVARASDHLLRINAKVILTIASFGSISTFSSLSMTKIVAISKTATLAASFITDFATLNIYALSGMNNFEDAIAMCYFR